ncbi:hypothetical protein FACUT_6224 [Fusarium acutatum]|uniref:Uncharacterized protein n=1 Tax=Fusarium acutatum TaxID=78861 RepID=A0A8H4JTB6_9HYPO|nr:hypothetical protein FACUT_6224 [Fusarium acutatum]
MSQPTGGTRRQSVPFLPQELSLRIIEESEEVSICLRTVVAELGLDEDIANPVLNLDKHAFPPHYDSHKLLAIRYTGDALLDRQFTATVPIEISGDHDVRHLAGVTRSQTALTHRLRPDDEKQACERIKHLMIRGNKVSEDDIIESLLELIDHLVNTPNGEEEGEEGDVGEEVWVAYLENNCNFRFEGMHDEAINWLYLFKDLVRPGG